MNLIKKFYSPHFGEIPKIYAVNRMILSMNDLQSERYLEREFLHTLSGYNSRNNRLSFNTTGQKEDSLSWFDEVENHTFCQIMC